MNYQQSKLDHESFLAKKEGRDISKEECSKEPSLYNN